MKERVQSSAKAPPAFVKDQKSYCIYGGKYWIHAAYDSLSLEARIPRSTCMCWQVMERFRALRKDIHRSMNDGKPFLHESRRDICLKTPTKSPTLLAGASLSGRLVEGMLTNQFSTSLSKCTELRLAIMFQTRLNGGYQWRGSGSLHVVAAPILLLHLVAAADASSNCNNSIVVQDGPDNVARRCETVGVHWPPTRRLLWPPVLRTARIQGPVTKLSRPGIMHGRSPSPEKCRLHDGDFGKC